MTTMRKTGRPSKLQPLTVQILLDNIASCLPIKASSQKAGISEDTLSAW
jgi:hypothetical protein